ncbi:MAG: glycosyltransferase family 87 protein [Pseudomonadota bacterium]
MPVSALRLFILCIVIAVSARWVFEIRPLLDGRWQGDLQYWWFSGRAWLDGVSPYTPEFLARVTESFPSYRDPLFYPPTALPIFALFPLVPIETAGLVFFVFNFVALIVVAVLLCADREGPDWPMPLALGVMLGFLGLLFMPLADVAAFGSLQMPLLLGLMAWLLGAQRGVFWLQGIGLAVLALKPPLALALMLWALLTPRFRIGALLGCTIVLALFIAGTWGHDPFEMMRDWIRNCEAYRAISYNDPRHSGGFGALGGLFGLSFGAWQQVALILVLPLFLAMRRVDAPVEGAMLLMAWSLFVTSGQRADLTLLVPAVMLLVRPGVSPALELLLPRLLLGLGLILISRSMHLTEIVTGTVTGRSGIEEGLMRTAALALIMAAVAWQATVAGRAGSGGVPSRRPSLASFLRPRDWAALRLRRRLRGSEAP